MSVVPHKMSDGSGVKKETVAQKKAASLAVEIPDLTVRQGCVRPKSRAGRLGAPKKVVAATLISARAPATLISGEPYRRGEA